MINALAATTIAEIIRFRYQSSPDYCDDGRWHFAYIASDGPAIADWLTSYVPDHRRSFEKKPLRVVFEDKADAALFKMGWWDSFYWLRGPDVSERGGGLFHA